ncbi:MAG: hypothetical protein WCS84_08335 [Nocardioides sp.]
MRTPVRVFVALLTVAVVAAPVTTSAGSAKHGPPAGETAPPARAAGVVLGSTPATIDDPSNCAPATAAQDVSGPDSPDYTAATAGVITSWSSRIQPIIAVDTAMRLMVFRPDGAGGQTVAALTPLRDLVGGSLNTFPSRIGIAAGDFIGLSFVGSAEVQCRYPGIGDSFVFAFGPNPAVGEPFVGDFDDVAARLNISAVLEPDADRDGYGDLTQDGCPSQPIPNGGACDRTAPQTRLTVKPPAFTRNRQAKFRFVSTERRSTFRCSLDGQAYRRCISPVFRRVSIGQHIFKVAATDRYGNRDRTPAVARWRVRR